MNAKKTSAIAVCVTAILVFSPIAPIHGTGQALAEQVAFCRCLRSDWRSRKPTPERPMARRPYSLAELFSLRTK